MAGPPLFNVGWETDRGVAIKEVLYKRGIEPGTLGPKPSTLTTKPSLHPTPGTPGSKPSALSIKPSPDAPVSLTG